MPRGRLHFVSFAFFLACRSPSSPTTMIKALGLTHLLDLLKSRFFDRSMNQHQTQQKITTSRALKPSASSPTASSSSASPPRHNFIPHFNFKDAGKHRAAVSFFSLFALFLVVSAQCCCFFMIYSFLCLLNHFESIYTEFCLFVSFRLNLNSSISSLTAFKHSKLKFKKLHAVLLVLRLHHMTLRLLLAFLMAIAEFQIFFASFLALKFLRLQKLPFVSFVMNCSFHNNLLWKISKPMSLWLLIKHNKLVPLSHHGHHQCRRSRPSMNSTQHFQFRFSFSFFFCSFFFFFFFDLELSPTVSFFFAVGTIRKKYRFTHTTQYCRFKTKSSGTHGYHAAKASG
jgi:hypothetical protein